MKIADGACCVGRCPLIRFPVRVEPTAGWREEQQAKQRRYELRETQPVITKDELANREKVEKSD